VIDAKFCSGVWLSFASFGVGVAGCWGFISLVELDDQLFFELVVRLLPGFGPFMGSKCACWGCFRVAVVGVWTSTESLILAQDERWRRA
jgi:hypothetical protein